MGISEQVEASMKKSSEETTTQSLKRNNMGGGVKKGKAIRTKEKSSHRSCSNGTRAVFTSINESLVKPIRNEKTAEAIGVVFIAFYFP